MALENNKKGNTVSSPCNEITLVSKKAYKWISSQNNVGEESITDWVLYEISQRIKKSGYIKFNRHQEARTTGADWEWWFVGKKHSIKLRIQAKKINDNKDVYPSLAYTNKYGLQIEKLIDDSKNVNAKPMYAFYTAPTKTPKLKCQGIKSPGKNEGIFISDANFLFNKYIKPGRSKVTASKILENSNPLSCLLCCPLSQSYDPIKSLLEFLTHYFSSSEKQNEKSNISGLHESCPNYVQHILDNIDNEIPDWWEQEFHNSIKDINAIMVFDLRELPDEQAIF